MQTTTMCAMQLTGFGGPEMLQYRRDLPLPQPAPGEVLIEVGACGINNTDIWTREGGYASSEDPDAVSSFQREASTLVFPRIQGADIVGAIVGVGEGVDAHRIGARVLVDFSIYNGRSDGTADMDVGNMDYIGNGRDGGFAEFVTVAADQARAIDSDLSDIELATFCCAGVTAEHLLERAAVQSGEHVLVTGASGGVGSIAIQLCRARGAIPHAITSASKSGVLLALGAASVIDRDSDDLLEAIRKQSGRADMDVVIDVVGGARLNPLLDVLRPAGRYATCGAIADPMVTIDLRTLYLKHLQIHGSSQGSRRDFDQLVEYIEAGVLRPLVGGVYKLSELPRAQSDFKRKQFIGKLVVVPDSKWSELIRQN